MGWMQFLNCVKIHCLHWKWDNLIDILNRNKNLTYFVWLNERFSHNRLTGSENYHFRLVNAIGNSSLINVFNGSFGRYWLVLLKNIEKNNFSFYTRFYWLTDSRLRVSQCFFPVNHFDKSICNVRFSSQMAITLSKVILFEKDSQKKYRLTGSGIFH